MNSNEQPAASEVKGHSKVVEMVQRENDTKRRQTQFVG
jgi:hypothetical protein